MALQRLEDLLHLVAAQGLLLEQLAHQLVEHRPVLLQAVERLLMGTADQPGHLLVDDAGHGLGVVALGAEVTAEERLGVTVAELHGADPLGHAVLGDHRPGRLGGLVDVVRGAGRRVVEDQFLGRPATEHVRELVEQLAAGLGVLVRVGHHHRVAEGAATRQDGHLLHRVGAGHRRGDQGVAALVVGGDEPLVLVHQPGALLRAGDDPVDRLVQRRVGDHRGVVTGGQQGRLVQHVGQVRAGEAGRTLRDGGQIDVRGHRLAGRVHLEDLLPALHIRRLDRDLPVEPTRAQQRGVEHVGAVGGGDQDDLAVHVEAVHLDQQLVEGLLALVVTAAHAGTAVPADSVDLVDEDDGRAVLLGLLEQVADPGGTDADEHLDEVGAGDREERHAGLAGDRAGQQRLAGAGRAVEQHTLGDLGADPLELGRLGEELLDLLQLLDRLLAAGDVGEGRLRGVLVGHLGPGLAEFHHLRAAALHGVQHEEEQGAEQQERHEGRQQPGPEAGLGAGGVPRPQRALADPFIEPGDDQVVLVAGPVGAVLGLLCVGHRDEHPLFTGLQDDVVDLVVPVEDLDDLGGVLRLVTGRVPGELAHRHQRDEHDDDPDQRTAEDSLHSCFLTQAWTSMLTLPCTPNIPQVPDHRHRRRPGGRPPTGALR
ncbi:hypothetical protein SDC9_78498 [bioreactor metagenome]|uniref:NAD-specific glutamate dehydrogenase n=1 Tax=bioreactor metagenome TaxID=1076179 RepID=A0A644YVR8_9ZZZZ